MKLIVHSRLCSPTTANTHHHHDRRASLGGTVACVRRGCTGRVALSSLTGTTNVGHGCFYSFFRGVARHAPIRCLGDCHVRRTYSLLLSASGAITRVTNRYNFGSIDCFAGAFRHCVNVAPLNYQGGQRMNWGGLWVVGCGLYVVEWVSPCVSHPLQSCA